MKLRDLLEAPIIDFEPLGDFDKPGAFRNKLDKKLVTHPLAIQQVHKFFETTEWNIRIFVCNKTGTGKFAETGAVNNDQLIHMFGAADAARIQTDHDHVITIIYVGNSGAERMPLTPWMMAHRMAHAFSASSRINNNQSGEYWSVATLQFFREVNRVLYDYYGIQAARGSTMNFGITAEYCALFNAIGTQRSSKHNMIKRPYEFLYEVFAQYMHTDGVDFNLIPDRVPYGSQAWGRPTRYLRLITAADLDHRQEISDEISNNLAANFRNVLYASEGKIFVM